MYILPGLISFKETSNWFLCQMDSNIFYEHIKENISKEIYCIEDKIPDLIEQMDHGADFQGRFTTSVYRTINGTFINFFFEDEEDVILFKLRWL